MNTSALLGVGARGRKTSAALALILMLGATLHAHAEGSAGGPIRERCGWFDHPSPGNATLSDREGEWTVAMQGQSSAEGDWPVFKHGQWVRTGHGSHGYGCACLKVRDAQEEQRITQIVAARAKALIVCRRDKGLVEPENPLAR